MIRRKRRKLVLHCLVQSSTDLVLALCSSGSCGLGSSEGAKGRRVHPLGQSLIDMAVHVADRSQLDHLGG
jgi:hypothetical protein